MRIGGLGGGSSRKGGAGGSATSIVKIILLLWLGAAAAQNREKVKLTISEEIPVGTLVGSIPTRLGFTYRFNQDDEQFSIDPRSGEIRTTARIDREATSDDQFDLIVLSSSPTYPIEVVIVVEDINDNAPEFPNPVSQLTFSEGSVPGTRVILDSAVDRDKGDNGKVSDYRIRSGNEDGKFRLSISNNPDNKVSYLHLETTGPLDRETKETYQLNITATDGSTTPLTGSMLLTITTLDINDNPPKFYQDHYTAKINESVETGSYVVQVNAKDIDEGENSRVSYFISPTPPISDQFNIDEETGVITTNKPLNCRDNNLCQLVIIARDHGNPRQEEQTNVKVKLIDANDHAPKVSFRYFPDQNAKFATVEENAKPGNLVSAITVTDRDKGDNGKTSVRITDGNNLGHFRLDSRGGIHIVRVASELDRETTRTYNLTVVAQDAGVPPRTSTAYLIIHVNDINDHPPVFTEEKYYAVLTEYAPIGSFVASPLALDEDTGVNSNIYYSIVEGNDLQWFDIHHNSGLITTRMQIDREKQDKVNLKISARDGGTSPKYAQTEVSITVEDENDESPAFFQPNLKLEISENTRVGSKITTLKAVDNDKGKNGTVTYQFRQDVARKYPGTFEINSNTGDITVKSLLDRETLSKYDLTAFAYDGGEPSRTSTMTISIDVLDTNDNSPVFYPLQYFVVLQSDFSQEEPVVQIRATDKDEGINAVLEFEFIDGDTSTFSLNEQNGQIYLRKPVKELRGNSYDLKVAVKDKKGRKSVENAIIQVVVESEKLQYLSCVENLYKFEIKEDSSISSPHIGREVGKVSLQDNTETDLLFEILDGNEYDTFTIGESTGMIFTKKPVDREMEEKTVLKIRVKSKTKLISAICLAEVKVEDENDIAPKITNSELIIVKEDAPIKEIIEIAQAVDGDKGLNARIQYKLSDDINGYFSVNEETGAIYLEKPLKESQSKLFYLTLLAADSGVPQLSSNFTFRIEVQDVNDHTPLFDLEDYDLSLTENSKVNSKIFWLKATDEDVGENARVEYQISSGDNQTFGIFPDGHLFLKMAVDREERDYYSLGVTASDHGDPQRSSTTTMTIHITDKNDNSPAFSSQAYTFFMNENEQENTYVGQIHATDKDIGRNAELTYSAEKTQQYFKVDPKTGFIISKTIIDREQLISDLGSDSLRFEVIVTDNGEPKHSDSATVSVTVYDENDNSPMFSKDVYVARVSESADIGKEVKAIFASDSDTGVNGDVSYNIINGNRLKRFSINSTTGVIFLEKSLDREDISEYTLQIQAKDGGKAARTSTCSVIIMVSDENDNAPKIANSELLLTLPEDAPVGQKVYFFHADDMDEGENAELRYFISGGSYQKHFNMDPYTGTLTLQKPLDYEKDKSFLLKVTASDQGSPSLNDTVTLKVFVTDVNDNPPRFPNTAIVRQIQEGLQMNSPVLTMDAHDADSGDNGKIEFSLAGYETGSAEKFSIDPKSGVITTVGDIDREEIDTYRFTVVATDLAQPQSSRLSAEKVITIIVEDINDNAPEFVSVPTGILTPNTQRGDVIMTIQASDRDSNSNGLVTYKLQKESYLFSIDHYSGELSLRNRPENLDAKYEFVVVATDEAVQSERKSSSTTVTILGLTSEASGPPFKQAAYSATIEESDPAGAFITTVELTEQTNQDFYIIDVKSESGRNNNLFRIDGKSGDIRTVKVIDREVQGGEFIINVLAVSLDGRTTKTSSCQINLKVEDINDTPPVFEDFSTIRFSEETNPGVPITTMKAYDADLDSVIEYSIVSGDTDTFSIDKHTGELSLIHTVDRETQETFRLGVRAADGKQFTDINVILVVQDANDNIPTFMGQSFSFDVYESAAKGTQVGKIAATDNDKGDNSVITYNLLTEWGNEVFSLNPSSGIFTLTSDLDYEKAEHYRFVVSGSDHGEPKLSSTVTVYINVKDVNDNVPAFTQAVYKAEVAEDSMPGSSILQVEATDLDAENNGEIEYSIIGEADEWFGVSNNGTMFSKRLLDREIKQSFSFIVKATDGGMQGGRHSATATVLLTLRDVNDQAPTFTSPAEGYIQENTPANTNVMSVTTVDLDEGENANVEYFLTKSDSDNFVIGRLDGIIRTTKSLDREERFLYNIVVTARDHGTPRLSADMAIKIHVVDENDNTPNFEPKTYSTTVLENATIGQNILHTMAFDTDEGLNGVIRYTIVSGDKTSDFTIGEYSGVIKVKKKLDFERKNAYQLTIQAEDTGTPVRYDTASVSIYIEDVNDSPPLFRHSPYLAYVVENGVELPRYVTTVTAKDKDNPPYNNIEYSMKRTFGGAFSINGSTGDIFLHNALDREQEPHYELEVVAVDIGYPRLSSTGTLSVILQDENDNSPSFEQEKYTFEIKENNEPNTIVATMLANDEDVGPNGQVRYTLKGEDAAGFQLDELSGELRTTWSLDREEKAEYSLIIKAEDMGQDIQLTGSTAVTVRVVDVNDNKPVFTNMISELNVPNSIKSGDFVYKFDAKDKDSGQNSRLQFYIKGQDSSSFNLDTSSGKLTARSDLKLGSSYYIEIEVFDSGKPALSSQNSLTVTVSDLQVFPKFATSVNQISIKEGLQSQDMPSIEANSINGKEVNYKIVSGNEEFIFQIDSNSGKLRAVKPVDHEAAESFDIYIGAFEYGSEGYMSYHKISVNVEDKNDNPPVFSKDYYEAQITEEQFPPVSVIKVTAMDADSGENGDVRYRLKDESNSEKFAIDPVTGEITTTVKLDREKQEKYLLHVEAYDSGEKPLTGSTVIKVTVEDINDNPPKFTRILSINITENSPIGTKVVTVETTDRDIEENANVTYQFNENPGKKFDINPTTGDISVIGDLDREERDEYLLKVVATDGAWRAETTVGINIQDENDNIPTFDKEEYKLMFPPSTASVAVVGRVNANDIDAIGPNSHIKYALRESSEYFSIDSSSGEILSKKKLRYVNTTRSQSIENVYLLTVIATDEGKPPLASECNVRILVTDKNMNEPKFRESEYTKALPNFASAGLDLIQVSAYDDVDTGLNAEIVYSLQAGQYQQYFSIDAKTGWIMLEKSLSEAYSKSYDLVAIASDKGEPPLSASAKVRFMPSGDNLHSPEFSDTSTQVIIPENEPLGTFIIKLTATDEDPGINGMIRYGIIQGNEQEMFEIDEKTGRIFISKQLDYDNENEYNLTVEARDLGYESKNSLSVLKIILTDVNDNVPFFEKSNFNAYLQENLPIGTEIITMNAIDYDSPRYALVQYSIEEEQIKQYFEIDAKTGVIRSKVSFDYEKYPKYLLHVVARNPGADGENKTLLTIHITGSNEFYPRFQQPVFQFAVSESAIPDTAVGQIRAIDLDEGKDGEVFYFLIGQSNDRGFKIDKTSGVISVQKSLDRESQNRFVLTVLAKNRGSILGNDTDEAQVIIQVQDGNDPPVFIKTEYAASIRENVAVGTTILTVDAVDKDVRPRNSQFSYSIIDGNMEGAFEVDPNSGSIRTVKDLDRESIETYLLTVAAIDNGSPPQTGTASITVRLEDVNDNPPLLDHFSRQATLKENSPKSTLVARLQPIDYDLPPNTSPFKFYLTGGAHMDYFVIDENTGDLRSKVSVDREKTPELYIEVDIHDSGKPSLMTKYPLTIIVSDENDNPSEPRILTIIVQTLNGDFTGGIVAPVRPKDADTTGDYRCEIKQGPTNIFQMRNNCDLSTGRLMNVNSYNLTVIGNDGIHDSVTSQVYMTFDKFEEQAKQQSFIIRIRENLKQNILGEVFREINFHTSATGSVQILSVIAGENHTDFFVAMRSEGQYIRKEIGIQTLKSELTGLAKILQGVDITMGYNACQDNPCLNKGKCTTNMIVKSETVIIEAEDIILNSPRFEEEMTCQCPENFEGSTCHLKSNPCENPNPCEAGAQCIQEGYNFQCLCPQYRTGTRCELEKTNSCDRNPCENGGTCRESNIGDFFCLCRPGFQGNVCQITLDPCQPNPCQNGGECLSKKPNYQCKCPDNYYGTNCEKSTFGFGEMSYMTFPPLDPNTNDMSITFSTTKPNSLLIYNFGEQSGGRSDFIAVELVEGKATFSFGGARTAITSISVNKYLTNGRWFKVTATRNNRVASLSVEDCTESGEYCKLCQAGDESCFTKDIGDTGTLSFNNNHMYFGGMDQVQPIIIRPEQVKSDDFVGCVKSLTINGQQMNLKTSFIASSGILSSCPIPGGLCRRHDCGIGECMEANWKPVCVCPGGVHAQDCERAIEPIALTLNATVEFKVSEKLQRMQLLASRASNKISAAIKDNEISFTFRTETKEGRIFSSANTNDYTIVYVHNRKLVYETKKSGFPIINVTSEVEVTDGAWHLVRIKQTQQILQVYLDDMKLDDDLESDSTHDFLDPYLNGIHFGGKRKHIYEAFRGCLVNFTINNEIQSFFGHSNLLPNVTFRGQVLEECLPNFLSITAGNDPVNVGVIIVVVFFVILIFAILGSFFAFRLKKKRYKKMQNRSVSDSQANSGLGVNHKNHEDSTRINRQKKQMTTTPQKPDVIEREIVNDSPIGYSPRDDLPDYSASMVMQEPEQPEHYDLENASSIAPSDIDIIYHYKGYREGGRHGRELNMDRWGRTNDKMANSPIRLTSLSNNKMQSTPLARLSPSSEMSHQTPRILTLQDISGKPLQSALLQTQQNRHSQRSLRTPMSNLSDSSGSDLNSSSRARRRKKKKPPGLTADEVDRVNNCARNSSLVSTLDGVSMDSGSRKKNKFSDLLETNTELLHDDNSSSDSPSENDSFTCSEYEYDAPYDGNKQLDSSTPGGMVFRKLNNLSDSERLRNEGSGGRGSLTTLNVSDDDLSGFASPTGPASWESLLNWSPNFNAFVGVFKDISELPDIDSDVRPNPLGDREEEEYI